MKRLGPAALLLLALPSLNAEPFELIGGVPIVNVQLNGKGPYRFLLDTGATHTLLTPATAGKLGFNAQRFFLASIGVAGATVTNLPVMVYDPPEATPLRLNRGLDYHGIVGHDFLARFVVTLDYPRRVLTIASAAGKDEAPGKVPFRNVGRGILVNGTIDGHSVPVLLDTGAAEMVVLPAVAAKLGLRATPLPIAPGVSLAKAGKVALGAVEMRDVELIVQQPAVTTAPYEAIFGTPLLGRCRLTIHYPSQYLRIEPCPP